MIVLQANKARPTRTRFLADYDATMRILLDFSRPLMLAAVIRSVVVCPFGYDV